MSIALADVQTPLTIDYPLLLLKGVFERSCGCNLNVVSHLSDSELVLEYCKTSSRWRSSVFKSFILLKNGANQIKIGCNHVTYSLQVNNICTRSYTFVRAVYVTFQNSAGNFQAPKEVDTSIQSACRRLGLAVRLLQTLTAETMLAEMGDRKTFKCAGDMKDKYEPLIQANEASAAVWCIQNSLNVSSAQALSAEALWEHVARDRCKKFPEDIPCGKWLAIVSCTHYQPLDLNEKTPVLHEDMIARTRGHASLGKCSVYTDMHAIIGLFNTRLLFASK